MSVQLVRLDPAVDKRLAEDAEYNDAIISEEWNRMADAVRRVVGRTLATIPSSIDELHWEGYFAVDEATQEVVGSCAFKGPPTENGSVEIAYFTYPECEGRGYATAMARRFIALAGTSAEAREVVAHTLPEANASVRVLEKVGMTFVGEVTDPEDGLVWRWRKSVTA